MLETLEHERARSDLAQGILFYEHSDVMKRLWPGLANLCKVSAQQPDKAALKQRYLYVMSIEAVKCLAESVVTTPLEADVSALLGAGYPNVLGGPISFIHAIGIADFVTQTTELEAEHGSRFAPPPSLTAMIGERGQFYPQ
jgi:3-hydroxyacyl-CoA dehydrogenase/enoyl-CoA hydratase/3-hydroxybutyryl-CoA epimerase